MKASNPTIMFFAFIPIIFVLVLANLGGVHPSKTTKPPLKCYSNLVANYDSRKYNYSESPKRKWNPEKQDYEQPLLFKTWIGYNETQCHPDTTHCLKAVCKGEEIRACNDWNDFLQCNQTNTSKRDSYLNISSVLLQQFENCSECAMCNTSFCNSAFGMFGGGGGGSKLFINIGGGIQIPFNVNFLMLAFAIIVAVGIGQIDGTFGHVAIGGD